jgi:hypothetical protein
VAAQPQSKFQIPNYENDPRKTPLPSALRPRHIPGVLAADRIHVHHEEAVMSRDIAVDSLFFGVEQVPVEAVANLDGKPQGSEPTSKTAIS